MMPLQCKAEAGSFEDLIVVDMRCEHLDRLHALSTCIGWPHRRDDWAINLDVGSGVVAIDAIGRIHGSAMYFPFNKDLSAIGMTIAHPRLAKSGLEARLVAEAIDRTGGRPSFLNACNASISSYRSAGAKRTAPVFQYQGLLQRTTNYAVECRAANQSDLLQICDCDFDAYSANRSSLLSRLAQVSEIHVIERGGKIRGFAMCRRFGRGYLIGPLTALDDADAILLAGSVMCTLTGHFVRTDTRNVGGAYSAFLGSLGLTAITNVTTMTIGTLPRHGRQIAYGLSGHSTG